MSASAGMDLCYTKINMTARKVSRKALELLVTQQSLWKLSAALLSNKREEKISWQWGFRQLGLSTTTSLPFPIPSIPSICVGWVQGPQEWSLENLGSLARSATFNSSVKYSVFKALIKHLSKAVLKTGIESLDRSPIKLWFAAIRSSYFPNRQVETVSTLSGLVLGNVFRQPKFQAKPYASFFLLALSRWGYLQENNRPLDLQ